MKNILVYLKKTKTNSILHNILFIEIFRKYPDKQIKLL